jgi:hypothetical protein
MTTLCITKPVPGCQTPGCCKKSATTRNYYNKDGKRHKVAYRRFCSQCHTKRTAAKHGLKRISQITAKRAGMTETHYRNQFHPYLKYRKKQCENQDGRLGFTCNTVLPTPQMLETAGLEWTPDQFLQVDHINGNPKDNRPENLQTLCGHCHNTHSA